MIKLFFPILSDEYFNYSLHSLNPNSIIYRDSHPFYNFDSCINHGYLTSFIIDLNSLEYIRFN